MFGWKAQNKDSSRTRQTQNQDTKTRNETQNNQQSRSSRTDETRQPSSTPSLPLSCKVQGRVRKLLIKAFLHPIFRKAAFPPTWLPPSKGMENGFKTNQVKHLLFAPPL